MQKQILRSPTPQTQAFAGPQNRYAQDDTPEIELSPEQAHALGDTLQCL